MPTGPVSGNQPVQSSPVTPDLKGFKAETLKLESGGQPREVAVSRKKGRFGNPLRVVRAVIKTLPFLKGKGASAKKTAGNANVQKNTFQQALASGKVTAVKPKTYVRPSLVESSAPSPLPSHGSRNSYTPRQSIDLSQLPRKDLLKLAQNPKEPEALRQAAVKELQQQPGTESDQTPPLPPRNKTQAAPGRKSVSEPPSLPEKRTVTDPPPPVPKKRTVTPQPTTQMSPQQTLSNAVKLALAGDNEGLASLLNETTDYRQVKTITQALTAKVGGKNLAAAQSGRDRMIELKHQDLANEAKAAGYTSPDQIKAYARQTLEKHPFFSKSAPKILANLETLLPQAAPRTRNKTPAPQTTRNTPETPPVPPRNRGTAGISSAKVQSPPVSSGFPGGEKLALYYAQGKSVGDQQAFVKDFTAGLDLLVEYQVTTRESLEKAISDIDKMGDPLIDPEGIYELAERAANGNGTVPTGKMINHKHYSDLRQYTRQHPVKTVSTDNARFRDIKSPAKTNVPLLVTDPQTGRTEFKKEKIHANFVPLSGRKGAIATQYPKDSTQSKADFWKMHLQHNTEVVVDLTQPGEKGIQPYYPTQVGQTLSLGDVSVTLLSQDNGLNTYQVTDKATGQSGEVSRYHYTDWVDKTAISEQQLSQLAVFVAGGDHTCIHCKAGVGRTMTTFGAAELLIKMRTGQITSDNADEVINNSIIKMRDARGPHSVQTESQRESLRNLVDYWLKNGTP